MQKPIHKLSLYLSTSFSDPVWNHTGSAEDEGTGLTPWQAHESPDAGWQQRGRARNRNHHTGDHAGRRVKGPNRQMFWFRIQSMSFGMLLLLKPLLISDVSSVPASCDSAAVSLRPLHRAGGEAVEERGLVAGAEPAGSVHHLQTHSVQLLET